MKVLLWRCPSNFAYLAPDRTINLSRGSPYIYVVGRRRFLDTKINLHLSWRPPPMISIFWSKFWYSQYIIHWCQTGVLARWKELIRKKRRLLFIKFNMFLVSFVYIKFSKFSWPFLKDLIVLLINFHLTLLKIILPKRQPLSRERG